MIRNNTMFILAIVVAVLSLALATAPAVARCDKTITVDWAIDEDPGSDTLTCGFPTGVYNTAVDGRCTFRRAFNEASGRDTDIRRDHLHQLRWSHLRQRWQPRCR